VTVQSAADLVLVAFASQSILQGSPTLVTPYDDVQLDTGGLQLYQGLFPHGPTPTIGPFASGPPCWGTLTMAISPK
jgi:hypothetical protein